MSCEHAALTFVPSAHAEAVGYCRATPERLAAATSRTGRISKNTPIASALTFPAPLVLPNDELALDPRCPPQSLRSWLREKDRNPVTAGNNIIYVGAPPDVDSDAQFIRSWTQPQIHNSSGGIKTPLDKDVLEYLEAFYHGLPVKPLPLPKLCYTNWETTIESKSTIPKYIGFNTPTECVGIRTRASPDGVFAAQLNLDDLLDAAISMLPQDAYALILLVHHDLFEGDDDEFVCGRAYGGSRVAVISTARYHPLLDHKHNMGRLHAWPASHCTNYVQKCCELANPEASSQRPNKKTKLQTSSKEDIPKALDNPMHAALTAFNSLPLSSSPSNAKLSELWLCRVCRAASHEVGHCFGIEHCSSCLAEDSRQPPYLCPVDLAKVLEVTGVTAEDRYQALLVFCDQRRNNQLFASYAAWMRAHLHDRRTDQTH
ncbi:hypothetical protein C0995_006380 [Termitomyces sp. Mi166|nr:hypothetical protein C0995_006380 [Termitomyces sp. Mi166\